MSRDRPGNERHGEFPGNKPSQRFGAEALNDRLLRVQLQRPNLNFPALVAHLVFRPCLKVAEQDDRKKIAAIT
jgi:ABC-type oligopeptide transport system substrate-binding subunit